VICNEEDNEEDTGGQDRTEDTGGQARVTKDEERVLPVD